MIVENDRTDQYIHEHSRGSGRKLLSYENTSSLQTVLIVDDNVVNRSILAKILSKEYAVIEAENGQVALDILNERPEEISAVMLDIVMPVMDGYAVLKAIQSDMRYDDLPILITTENSDSESEIKALTLGAWDFVSKPYNPQTIIFRLKNAIDRSQLPALKKLKYLSEYDALTGVYNKEKFFAASARMLELNREQKFVFLRFDVDRFQLINSFFGVSEGDNLLMYIARNMEEDAKEYPHATYGRIESDIFGLCIPYDEKKIDDMMHGAKDKLAKYNPNYDIVPSIGIYVIDDCHIPIEEMYNRATLAAKICKGNYVDFYAYYTEKMSYEIANEQEITNGMNFAMESGQFQIYLQPQYNIHTNLPCGAEVLVRWIHPKKGIISPGVFIPVFERNGFISKLDYYVWEQACQCLCRWKKQGITPYPLSVNVSRVNIYNPKLPEMFLELVNRYDIEPSLLNLELTESAYTDNPLAMKKTIEQLKNYGFTVMMDDFGNGYSSLSLLKDIVIDVLKIDMRFLSETEILGRGENIIASVIRMAKWLNIPVIAEGAETKEQVDFLRSVGCDYVQGYFFARPMPVGEYEALCRKLTFDSHMLTDKNQGGYRYDELFSLNQELKLLFNNALQAAAIYEFSDNQIEMIRVNEAYYALLGHNDMLTKASDVIGMVNGDYQELLLNTFSACVRTREVSECEYMRGQSGAEPVWIHTKLRYVATAGNKHILIGELTDITIRKSIDTEIQKYKLSLDTADQDSRRVLIVDDAQINRTILKNILRENFTFLEAGDGEEAIKVLKDNRSQVDLILLDISMPNMDGKEFLRYKEHTPELDAIPVIMITADDSPQQQISTFALGASDYIIKPFIPQVIVRRVKNVLEANHRFKEMVREYNNMSEQVKIDQMTGLINRASAADMMQKRLDTAGGMCAMLMIDIDSFKKINDLSGHDYGDKVICAVAATLHSEFRKEDIVARMGGDEFSVFLENISSAEFVKNKAKKLCAAIGAIAIDGRYTEITCSVGIAVSNRQIRSFDGLYQNSDRALYNSKCHGKNTVSIYGEEAEEVSVSNWIADAQDILDSISDGIYACDKDTHEMIYANKSLCNFMGVTQSACRGKKCYEVLMNRTSPCEFCSLSKTPKETVNTRLFRLPGSQDVFLLRGKDVKRNGVDVHFEVAVKVTKIENMELYTEEADSHGQ
ncbi:MAG: EAL domain-containing protein [Oscillospiraceae bacterium]